MYFWLRGQENYSNSQIWLPPAVNLLALQVLKFVCIGAIWNDNISWSLFSGGFGCVELVQIAGDTKNRSFALKQINKRKIKYLCLLIMKCIFDRESKGIIQIRKHGRLWQSTFLPFRYGRSFIWELFEMTIILDFYFQVVLAVLN